jgi:hypothetical protein
VKPENYVGSNGSGIRAAATISGPARTGANITRHSQAGEIVAKRVARHALGQSRQPPGVGDRPLHRRFVQTIPRRGTVLRIAADAPRRKDELPPPRAAALSGPFPPFPRRTTICPRSKSTSFTRRSRHSLSRNPPPYNNMAAIQFTPRSLLSTRLTSARLRTTGKRAGRFAQMMPSRSPSSRPSTDRYRHSRADSA